MRGTGSFRQGKLVARRRRRAFYLCLYTLSAAGLILCGLSYISGIPALLISEVTVQGNSRLATSIIEQITFHDLEGTYWHFFPRADALIYPHDAIRRDLLALPLIETATVSRDGLKSLSIKVSERQTAALWCAEACYSVDQDGFIFAPRDGNDQGFIYKSDITSEPIGQSVTSAGEFKKIQFFMTELAQLQVGPETVELAASSTYMTIVLNKGGKLVVNTADDLSTVLGNIGAIISDRSVAPSLGDFLSKLDYMKLDVGNKVVFKLK